MMLIPLPLLIIFSSHVQSHFHILDYNKFFGEEDDFAPKDINDNAFFLSAFAPNRFLETLLNIPYDAITDLEFIFNPIDDSDVKFWLYRNGMFRHEYDTDFVDRILYELDQNAPIKFIVHGYKNSGNEKWVEEMAQAYENIGIKNVFSVDWSSHSKLGYLEASKATLYIGKILAKFISNLVSLNPNLFDKIHIIGFSLGAHIAGFAGKEIQSLLNKKLQRITFLDPANPLFEAPFLRDCEHRACGTDAVFTDAYHTTAGYFGFDKNIAQVDIFLHNGGPIQPSCLKMGILRAITCSHSYAHDFWTKAIENTVTASGCLSELLDSISHRCILLQSTQYPVGENISHDLNGRYYYRKISELFDGLSYLPSMPDIFG